MADIKAFNTNAPGDNRVKIKCRFDGYSLPYTWSEVPEKFGDVLSALSYLIKDNQVVLKSGVVFGVFDGKVNTVTLTTDHIQDLRNARAAAVLSRVETPVLYQLRQRKLELVARKSSRQEGDTEIAISGSDTKPVVSATRILKVSGSAALNPVSLNDLVRPHPRSNSVLQRFSTRRASRSTTH